MGWIKKVISVGGFILLGCQVVSANEVQSYPYALFWNDYQMTPGISKGAVSIDDVLEWRDICREELGDEMETNADAVYESYDSYFADKSCEFLNVTQCADWYEVYDEEVQQSLQQVRLENYYIVFNDEGQYVYQLSLGTGEYSSSDSGPFLRACVSGNVIPLRFCTDEELQDFLQEERERYTEKRNLSMNNVEKADDCQFISGIWELRDILGIEDIYYDTSGQLCIAGIFEPEEFQEKLNQQGYQLRGKYYMGVWYMNGRYEVPPDGIQEEQKQYVQTMAREDEPEKFVEQQKMLYKYTERVGEDKDLPERMAEEQWENLKIALTEMKKMYPEYSCRNLYYHIAGDYNVEEYTGFDPELLAFAETLEYRADKNQVSEDEFGDPEHLELKNLLRKYKEKYPELTYLQIYQTYLQETEESVQMSKREKLYWYLWQKYSFDKKTENIQKEGTNGQNNSDKYRETAVAGIIVLVFGAVAVKLWMKKAEKG